MDHIENPNLVPTLGSNRDSSPAGTSSPAATSFVQVGCCFSSEVHFGKMPPAPPYVDVHGS